MRLVHAVLLPGIIVFVSNGNLLHAHALHEDETGVTAGRQLRAAASEVFGLSRASFGLGKAQDPLDKFFSKIIFSGKPIETSYSAKGIHEKIIEAHDLHVSKSKNAPIQYASVMEYLKKTYPGPDIERIVSTLERHDEVGAKDLGAKLRDALDRQ
uniref:Avirulence protein ATR13 n=2 Tax=Hyaloperonospora TaxID=184462 RepID=ATR13_HYAAB|nr:RecName: Full=Avirulence protein ATR13; AltName: Full=Arabidopsis thaliana recognized protein 13; Flags: Precursor [Hyaloperonospora arabidopsidis]AAW63767.1 avirulence protein ATR13 [Hyaloperonospora parasitica]AAW63768.1 avirulence protein ATR13 [Hyaloperonospora parasitica]